METSAKSLFYFFQMKKTSTCLENGGITAVRRLTDKGQRSDCDRLKGPQMVQELNQVMMMMMKAKWRQTFEILKVSQGLFLQNSQLEQTVVM